MIRSTFRNIMLLILVACFGIAYFTFRKTEQWQLEIAEQEGNIVRLTQELENAQNLNVALTELDNLTITEQTATQLDILRHLGLEQSDLNFGVEARDIVSVGGTSLYAHTVRISAKMPYPAALALADRLQNTKKIVLQGMDVATVAESNDVTMNLIGKIYGLEKVLPPPEALPVAEPEASPTTSMETDPSATESILVESPVSATEPASVSTTEATQ